jgi:hypothetical protein
VLRPVARALLAGDEPAIRRQAEAVARWKTRVDLLDVESAGAVLRLSGLGQQYEETVDPMPDEPPEVRFLSLLDPIDAAPSAVRFRHRSVGVTLTDRISGEQWPVPVTAHGSGLQVGFTADLDLETLAAGKPLPPGNWDLHVHYRVLGLGTRVRAQLVAERSLGRGRVATPSLQARPVLHRRALSVEVGTRVSGPMTWPGRLPHGLRWRWRRLRRQMSRRTSR